MTFRQPTAGHLSKNVDESKRRQRAASRPSITRKYVIAYGVRRHRATTPGLALWIFRMGPCEPGFPPPRADPAALRNSTQREPVCESRNDIACAALARPTATRPWIPTKFLTYRATRFSLAPVKNPEIVGNLKTCGLFFSDHNCCVRNVYCLKY